MDTSINRDFNIVAKIILGLSMYMVIREIISCFSAITTYRLFGVENYENVIILIIINILILIAGGLTFLKKRYGLIALTILFLVRIININWSSDISIGNQFAGTLAHFIRDFGIFAIAMCFRKDGVSGWRSMLSTKGNNAEQGTKKESENDIKNKQEADNLSIEEKEKINNTAKENNDIFVVSQEEKINSDNNTICDHIIEDVMPHKKDYSPLSIHSIHLSKGLTYGIVCIIGIIAVFIVIAACLSFKSYPNYISSFSDKVRYSFNLSNNQLGKTLFDRVSSSRSKSLHLIVTPGYANEVFDSKEFYKIRVDEFREYPSSSFYVATTPINSFEDIISEQYYIIKPGTGEPYACKGSELSLDGDNARSRIIYKTEEYDYKKSLDKEMSLVDEAAQILVSDIDIIKEIGGYYEHEGILSKAADYYRFALEHNGNNPQIRGMLAYVLALNGESEAAREEAEKTIEIDSKEQKALSALALLEADEFNWKEAKTYAKKAIDYGADESNVYLVYCEALYKQGEIKAAQNYYNKAYELYRYNPRLEKYKEYAGCPFEVLAFHYCSEKMDGKNVIPYDEKLVKSKCFYIGFKIDVNILRSERAKIGVKLFTNGRLITGQGSKEGYTYFENVGGKNIGKNFYNISGWGNESGGFWSVGSHEIEIWYEGNKIAESSFYVY